MQKYFTATKFEDLRSEYKTLLHNTHRDAESHADYLAKMKLVDAEYHELFDILVNNSGLSDGRIRYEKNVEPEFRETLKKIINLKDVTLEVCGNWIWVTGDTKPVKEDLKKSKFKFSGKKVAWYWKPSNYRKFTKKIYTLPEIREYYGSKVIEDENELQ